MRKACSLGVGLAGGTFHASHAFRQRLRKFRMRLPRFAAARRLAINTAKLLRTGGMAGVTYGEASVGVSPSLLHAQRVAAARALGDRTTGGDLDLTLAIADGAKGGLADPAFQAHLQPIVTWTHAAWAGWMPRPEMTRMAAWAMQRLSTSQRPWTSVCGPATAAAATMSKSGSCPWRWCW